MTDIAADLHPTSGIVRRQDRRAAPGAGCGASVCGAPAEARVLIRAGGGARA